MSCHCGRCEGHSGHHHHHDDHHHGHGHGDGCSCRERHGHECHGERCRCCRRDHGCCGDQRREGRHHRFERRFTSKAEKIARLEAYLADLKAEVQGVEERLNELKR